MNPIDVICALLGIGTTGYLLLNYQELVLRAGLNTQTDIIVGIIGVLMVFEATRRTVGWPMLTVALIFVAYAFLGPYMPGILAHRGVGFDELVSHLFFYDRRHLRCTHGGIVHFYLPLHPLWCLS